MNQVANLSPIQLTIRCIAERKGDQWQAFSLEFGLAAQGDSLDDVKRKLESMILNYVHDALIGEDRQHAVALLSRRATLSVFLKYYLFYALSVVAAMKDRILYREALALEPKLRHA